MVRDPHFGVPALYIYDKYPGGTGLAEGLVRCISGPAGSLADGHTGGLFAAINEALARCPCKSGCPSCVGPGGNKAAAEKFTGALVH
ncbi:MAG: DUF1998 domain-containing protein [Treponema sp.]|jgi:DEAD/DEAH box helicase domain-containing protein|nr:DUF1998 domain-containing protein [Treponema sp.]